jgi:pimeloyl-ACP methyl ester carboxylesterase
MSVPAFLEKGSGGTPIVFLHGIGGGAEAWAPQLDFFGRDRRALAWWMPGYGDARLASETSFEGLVDRLADLLEATDIDRLHLVGHSMGGMIAQLFAARRPERLASLCLVGTTPVFGSRDGSFQKAFVEARLRPLDEGRAMPELAPEMVAGMIGDAVDPEGRRIAIDVMGRTPEDAFRASIHTIVTFSALALLGDIAAPTLLVGGSKDTNAPSQTMEKMAAKIAGSRFVLMDGAGHLPNLEQPATFNALLASFIDAVESGAHT